MISTVVGARIQIRSIFTLANNTTRVSNLCGRKEHVYGNEEGHDVKNEFRKDKWIKKHRRTTAGEDWRLKNGYQKYPTCFLLDNGTDWSDVDTELPGPPTDLQKIRKLKNQRLAQDVFDAYMLVQRAKDIKT